MIEERFNLILGIIKIFVFKLIYYKRIKFKGIVKIYSNFKFELKKKSNLEIGEGFRARNNVIIRTENNSMVTIGNGCFFNDGCSINCRKKIVIGDKVLLGQNVLIFDHDHDYMNEMSKFNNDDVKIGNNVWIGANVTILKGVKIGDNVVIGANTLVNEDIPNNTLFFQEKKSVMKIIKKRG